MAITINGVTYRNLPEQVKENAENIETMKADIVELQEGAKLKYEVVDELPEIGESGIIYLVPLEDGENPNIYEEYLWVDGEWEMIGTTAIDLSNYVTLDGTQTITGVKTFSNGIKVGTNATATPNSWGTVVYANDVTGLYTFNTILESQTLRPTSSGEYDLGIATRKWRDYYTSGNIYLSKDGVTREWRLNDDGYGTLNIASSNSGGAWTNYYSFQTGGLMPLTNNQDLGTNASNQMWRDIYLSNAVYIHGNTEDFRILQKNDWAIEFQKTNGGSSFYTLFYAALGEFYTQNHYPMGSDNFDLGRNIHKWRDLYLSGSLKDGTNSVSVSNIAQKGVSLVTSGAMVSGSVTFNISDLGGLDDGLYIVVFNNTQVHLYLTSTMFQDIAQTGYPITQSCVVPYKSGGNVTIKAGVLAIEMPSASTVRFTIGTASLEYPEDSNLYIYKTNLM